MRARALVNAAGPWVNDIVSRVAGQNSTRNVRLVKGSHIVVPKFWEGRQAYLIQNSDKRVIFVNPYENDLALIGTTDIPYEGRPEEVAAEASEIDYLIKVVNRYFKRQLTPQDVVYSFSGVRPLYDDNADNPSAVTRDYIFELDAPGGDAPLLSVFGGKITTFRKLAEHALEKIRPFFPTMKKALDGQKSPCRAATCPTPTSSSSSAICTPSFPWLPPVAAEALCAQLRHAHARSAERGQKRSRSRPPFRPGFLRARSRFPVRDRMGDDRRRRSRTPHQARAAHQCGRARTHSKTGATRS